MFPGGLMIGHQTLLLNCPLADTVVEHLLSDAITLWHVLNNKELLLSRFSYRVQGFKSVCKHYLCMESMTQQVCMLQYKP